MVKVKNSVKKSIVRTIEYLQDRISITEVILFGSYASGTPHKYSDIDIAVVSPDFENKDVSFKADIFSKAKINCSIDVDIHPFTDKARKNARPTNFMGHILKTGTVIFKDGVLSL
jgi:predicted nucleotidyltransferase